MTKAFGLHQVILTDQAGANPVALPVSMVFRFVEEIVSETFTAEVRQVAAASWTTGITWELEAGGVALPVWAKLTGRPLQTSMDAQAGQVQLLSAMNGDEFPYFRVYGKSMGDSGDDIHGKIFRAKVTNLEGTFREGEFFVTGCRGVGVYDPSGNLFQFVRHERAIALT